MRSIHFRLILWYSSLLILVLAVFGAYAYHNLQTRLYSEMEQTLSRRAHNIADNILTNNAQQKVVAEKIDELYSPENNSRFIRILKTDGTIFYISGQPRDKEFDVTKIPAPGNLIASTREEKLGRKLNMIIVEVPAKTENGSFIIEMGALTNGMDSALHNLIRTLLLGLPIVVLIIGTGGYVLVQRSLKPVENIRAKAEQITFGNLSNRLPVKHTGDALQHLSETLNQMLRRLEDAYEQAKRFSADASHELRTPLAIMRGELESLLKRDLPDDIIGSVGSVLEEIERLSHITESLFAISRLDAGEAKIQNIKFDLTDLVKSTAEQMKLMAVEKAIQLTIDAKEPVYIEADPARLKQVVVNLLDNAIKYTPEKGNILIRVHNAVDKAIFEIIDSGIGIPKEALPHVFERFYRADKVRSREIGGAGLGLSIVRSICHAHGGNIELKSVEGKGTVCRIEL